MKGIETGTKIVLHVGCGTEKIHPLFSSKEWLETRLDIDPDVMPDIVSSITRMDAVENESVDAVYSSHNLEHLFYHEVPICLKEFQRILKPDGFALIGVPNLKKIAELIAMDKMDEPAYHSPAGPIYPLDILYGFRPAIVSGNSFMAHKTGFTPASLGKAVLESGFAIANIAEDTGYGIWIKAYKQLPPHDISTAPLW